MALPASVAAKARKPMVVNAMCSMLKAGFPDVPIYDAIPPMGQLQFPFVIVNDARLPGFWGGDPRGFMEEGSVTVSVYAQGYDAADEGRDISLVMRDYLLPLALRGGYRLSAGSYVSSIDMIDEPMIESDWATSAGPVQQADLPEDVVRVSSLYHLMIRVQSARR